MVRKGAWRIICKTNRDGKGDGGVFIVLTPEVLPLCQSEMLLPKLRSALLHMDRSLHRKFLLVLVVGHPGNSVLSMTATSAHQSVPWNPRNPEHHHTSPWENSILLLFCEKTWSERLNESVRGAVTQPSIPRCLGTFVLFQVSFPWGSSFPYMHPFLLTPVCTSGCCCLCCSLSASDPFLGLWLLASAHGVELAVLVSPSSDGCCVWFGDCVSASRTPTRWGTWLPAGGCWGTDSTDPLKLMH